MLCDLLAVYDLVAIVVSGLAARYIHLVTYRSVETQILEYASLILVTAVFFQFVARQNRLYDAAKVEDLPSQLYTTIYVWAATFAMTFIMLFFMKASDFYSRAWFIYWSAHFPGVCQLRARGVCEAGSAACPDGSPSAAYSLDRGRPAICEGQGAASE